MLSPRHWCANQTSLSICCTWGMWMKIGKVPTSTGLCEGRPATQLPRPGSAVRSRGWPVHQAAQRRARDCGDPEYWQMGHGCHSRIPQRTSYEIDLNICILKARKSADIIFFPKKIFFVSMSPVEWQYVTGKERNREYFKLYQLNNELKWSAKFGSALLRCGLKTFDISGFFRIMLLVWIQNVR